MEVFGLKIWIIRNDGRSVGIGRKQFENAADRDPHAAYTWFAAAFSGFDGDAIEQIDSGHVLSLDHQWALMSAPGEGLHTEKRESI